MSAGVCEKAGATTRLEILGCVPSPLYCISVNGYINLPVAYMILILLYLFVLLTNKHCPRKPLTKWT
jgi:hypothetical protein